MATWLISLILAHSSATTLNAWACDSVYKLNPQDKSGCYDICDAAQGNAWLELSHEMQNACAVVLNGGEY